MGWIGVDLDGTLAHYDGFNHILDIGHPIPDMVNRVKAWINEGRDVRVFTARVGLEPYVIDRKTLERTPMIEVNKAIEDWTLKHIGTRLMATCIKDLHMEELYDDRAVQVEVNTGKIIGYSRRNLVDSNDNHFLIPGVHN